MTTTRQLINSTAAKAGGHNPFFSKANNNQIPASNIHGNKQEHGNEHGSGKIISKSDQGNQSSFFKPSPSIIVNKNQHAKKRTINESKDFLKNSIQTLNKTNLKAGNPSAGNIKSGNISHPAISTPAPAGVKNDKEVKPQPASQSVQPVTSAVSPATITSNQPQPVAVAANPVTAGSLSPSLAGSGNISQAASAPSSHSQPFNSAAHDTAPGVASVPGQAEKNPVQAANQVSKADISGSNSISGNGSDPAKPSAAPVTPKKFLKAEATNALFLSKMHKAGDLAHHAAATKSASAKIAESIHAQDTPSAESQAKSNEGQVSVLNSQPAPPKSEEESKKALDEGISNAMPANLDDIDNFKESGKGKDISKSVMTHVSSNVADVKAGFGGISEAPQPAPAEKGNPLPAPEEAVPVAPINMGAGVVPAIDHIDLDTKQYVNQSENLLKQEEVSQEQLDMVDTGDLATANKARKKLQTDAKTQPVAVQQMATQEHKKVESEMQSHETNARAEMHQHRKQHLDATGTKQLKAKQDLEKKRADVARTINQRYETCQKSINSKLNDLEKNSLAQFDSGQTRATSEFETQVKNDIDKFKDKRYSQIGGGFLWLKDKLVGIDGFPEVTMAFRNARTAFVTKIDALIASITKSSNEVIAGCKKELEDTKAGIAVFVAGLGKDLQDVGKQAQEEVNKKLQELGSEIDKRKEKLQQSLADKRKNAIEAIDKKIEAMKASMSGALSIIGNLLLQAAMKFFKWALQAAGLSPDEIMGAINKGVAVIKIVVSKPIEFVKNLISAAKLGFKNFGKNFLTHLKDAIFNWLTGALEGVHLPKVWDIKGIFSLVLDILGITYQVIRGKMVKLMGEPAVATLEKVFTLVKTLITDGPIAAWEQLKEMAVEMKDTFVDAIKSWIQNTIIFKAIEAVVEMFIPGAGIVKAIIGIYDTVMFFIQKAKDIARMVGSFLNSIGDIAAGKIDSAANALEGGLATALSLVINFLAKFLHLDGITNKIKQVIEKIRAKVSDVMDKVVLWIQKMAASLLQKGKDAVGALLSWWKLKKGYKDASNVSHTLYFDGEDENAKLMRKSVPQYLDAYLSGIESSVSNVSESNPKKGEYKAAIDAARNQYTVLRTKMTRTSASTGEEKERAISQKRGQEITEHLDVISTHLAKLPQDFNKPEEGSLVVPESEITWGAEHSIDSNGIKSIDGTSVNADPLTFRSGGNSGSVPSYSSALWLALRKEGKNAIRGHLLNHQVFGTGASAKNLVPIPGSVNTAMEPKIESFAKEKVLQQHKVIRYNVVVKWPEAQPNLPANKFSAEQLAPTQIQATLVEKKFLIENFAGKSVADIDKAKEDKKNWVDTTSGNPPVYLETTIGKF